MLARQQRGAPGDGNIVWACVRRAGFRENILSRADAEPREQERAALVCVQSDHDPDGTGVHCPWHDQRPKLQRKRYDTTLTCAPPWLAFALVLIVLASPSSC